MSIVVGARDLKNRLGSYLRLARGGTRVIVTERGRPVAELRALESADTDLARQLQRLAAEGLITLPSLDHLPPRERVRMKGAALSEAILQDRMDRW
jgi:prevent-host-death family protein